jgi:DNA-binding MarR family transcriptional regulator
MPASSRDTADLMIQLIDEIVRGRTRLPGNHSFHTIPELKGLAGTVLAAIVLATQAPTVPQIGRSLGYPRQTIQRQADLLVALGLARFVHNPEHKRAHRLVATAEGARQHREADLRSRAWAAQFTAELPPEDLAATVETLRLIRHRLEAEARGRPRIALPTPDVRKV